MTALHSYLTFNGNCREAMTFYQECLGGALVLQTVGDSPLADQLPKQMRHTILHATLTKEEVVLMASDMVSQQGLLRGNAVSLMLHCSNEREIKELYEKLSEEGEKTHPLERTFFGALLGNLTDKFGNHWLLYCPLND